MKINGRKIRSKSMKMRKRIKKVKVNKIIEPNKTENIISKVSSIAANWWGDKVCNPKFDNGDNGSNGGMVMMLAILNTKSVDETSKKKFIKILEKAIINELESRKEQHRTPKMTLSVDYNPDMILSNCAKVSGISDSNFPWKTTMWMIIILYQ